MHWHQLMISLVLGTLTFLVSPQAQAQSCPSLPTNTGSVVSTVSLPSTGSYRVWSRVRASDTINNSVFLQIDGGCAFNVGDSSTIHANTFTWVDYQSGNSANKITVSLSAGTHTVKLIGRENNVGVDKLLFSNDLTCVPTGLGTTCGTVVTPTKSINTPTPTKKPTPTPTFIPGSTKMQVQLFLHGIGKGGDSANPIGNGNSLLAHPQRQVTVEVYNAQNQLMLSKTGTVWFDSTLGGFAGVVDMGTSLSSGNYLVRIKSLHYLTTLVNGIQNVTKGATILLPKTTMVAGDISGDNILNVVDYSLLTGCYADLTPAKNCNATNQTAADLNDDGVVNQFDYNLFIREITTRAGQ